MSEDLYTTKTRAQFRGPTNSDKYNERIENNFKDLAFLKNRSSVAEERAIEYQRQTHKTINAIEKMVNDLERRLFSIEDSSVYFDVDTDDTDRFNETPYEVNNADRLNLQPNQGPVTLPVIMSARESRVRFRDSEGNYYLPGTFRATAAGVTGSADSSTATVQESNIYNAFLNKPGRVWERNVVVNDISPSGAMVDIYIAVPVEAAPSLRANLLRIDPFPAFGVDILSVAYSTERVVNLNDADNYVPLNQHDFHSGDTSAVGFVPPGAWDGDEILKSGIKTFHFDPQNITALKITLRTKNYYVENNKVVYTYGLNDLDLRSEKHLDQGRLIFKFVAPAGRTISSVDDVNARLYNISVVEGQQVFDYRVIWETSYDSGQYTLDPVQGSTRVWIEVTLRKTGNGGTPALSSLDVEYS